MIKSLFRRQKTPQIEYVLNVADIEVHVWRKPVKNMRLTVNAPDGKVRVSVPRHLSDDTLTQWLQSRISWIKEKQARFIKHGKVFTPDFVTGEKHYFLGEPCPLIQLKAPGRAKVTLDANGTLVMTVPNDSTIEQRSSVLDAWYRQEFKKLIPPLVQKWEPVIGERVGEWRIKKMKTRWGTCNSTARRIWLNLELIKMPIQCIEYVLVHEMVHFLERSHNHIFKAYMDKFLPDWRLYKNQLNGL